VNAWSPIAGEILEEGPWLRDGDDAEHDVAERSLADAFRTSMRRLAGGTCAISIRHGAEIDGLTATSVTSLSMEPPSLLVSIRSTSRIMDMLRRERRFTVHILGEGQEHEANAFAGRLGPGLRANHVAWEPRGEDSQRLSGATCHVDCKVAKFVPVFSHIVVVGVVEAVDIGDSDRPLVYFDGAFHTLGSR
jgi:flavin reductase (DIM6/NTAB) family NADH-FMN oxidoreductase RutF